MRQKEFESNLVSFQEKLEVEPGLFFIKKLKKNFPEAEIFLVGGAVRDAAGGRFDQKDYDFVVRNIEAPDLEKFLSSLGQINLVGKTFGVYKFFPKEGKLTEAVDIAFPRTEHAFGTGGYRDVKTKSDPKMPIEEDLSRRDFTINAMAWDLKNRRFIDPFSGLADLEAKMVKAVGDAHTRFGEDYSRILRGIRFACQFGYAIEEKTYLALREMMARINDEREVAGKKERILPYEVAAKELVKAFYHHPARAFELYDQSGGFKMLMPEVLKMKGCPQPEVFHSEGDVFTHTRLVLEKIHSEAFEKQFGKKAKDAELVVACLLHDIGKPATIKTPERDRVDRIRFDEHDVKGAEIASSICKRLKLDSLPEASPLRVDPKRISQLVKYHMLTIEGNVREMRPGTIEKYFFNPNFPGENLLKLTYLDASATIPLDGKIDLENFYAITERIEELRQRFEAKAKLPLPILDGHEIMAYFKLPPGPKVGELIRVLREAQLGGEIKNKEEAYKFLKKQKKQGPVAQ